MCLTANAGRSASRVGVSPWDPGAHPRREQDFTRPISFCPMGAPVVAWPLTSEELPVWAVCWVL